MSKCLFCQIAAGEIPGFIIHEDELFIVILDRYPGTKGHMLIIPKRHAENVFELNESEAEALMPLAKKMAEKVNEVLKPDGINFVQNNGKDAGQVIFHYHMHLVPRYKGDGVVITHAPSDVSLEELGEVAKLFK